MRSKKKRASKSMFISSYRISAAAIGLGIIISGVLMIIFSTRLYKNERFKEIKNICNLFIDDIQDEYETSHDLNTPNITKLYNEFTNISGLEFSVYDYDQNCIISMNDEKLPLSNELKRRMDSESFIEFDANDISDKEQSILYGTRFTLKKGQDDIKRYYLTATLSANDINYFTSKLIFCFVIVCILCMGLIIYILRRKAYRLAHDSMEFLRVSEKYSNGDFSEPIVIQTPGNLKDISKCVNVLADEVKNANETSHTFIANVSHELRTPITTIGGFVDGILDGTIPKSRQQEYLILVSKEIKRLTILIRSMLNMTKFEAGTLKPNFSETNLTELVIQTVLMFEKRIESKHLEIIGLDSERLIAEADPDLIQQVIYNLVENAVKFVNDNGTLTFTFEEAQNMTFISIKNTGEGLKESEIPQIFDRFYKTDASRGKDSTGLGLGLSISRDIIRIHNGRIAVRSVYGEYTEFVVKLPKHQK